MKKSKLIYVLPHYDTATGTHLFYLYDFIARLAEQYDLWLITLDGDDPRSHIKGARRYTYLGKTSPTTTTVQESDNKKKRNPLFVLWRLVRYTSTLKKARFLGYARVYVHYSYWAAIVAALVMRCTGGRVWYWNCGMPWLFGKQFGLRATLLCVHTLVTGTERMKELYHEHYGISLRHIVVMPNWIDLTRFDTLPNRRDARATLGLHEEVPIVLFVHKLVERKGADLLTQIAECLPNNVHMVVVGGGPLLDALKKQANGRGLNERMHFTGWVPARDIPMYMRAADVYVMPSREEGFPHTILEAMAAGTPFVATDVGGMKDIVPAEYIETVLATTVSDMAKKISVLLGDRGIYIKTSSALGEHVLRYTIERIVSEFKKMI